MMALPQQICNNVARVARLQNGTHLERVRTDMHQRLQISKPVIGSLQLSAMRGAMRLVNALPPVKQMIARNVMRVRGSN
jgi:hypothetical protein